MARLLVLEDPKTIEEAVVLLEGARQQGRFEEFLEEQSTRGDCYRYALGMVEEASQLKIDEAKDREPLKTCEPCYEQCLKLNSWIWGFNNICDFDANRIGKTACGVIGSYLWIFPNDPDWKMFQNIWSPEWECYIQVFQRPSIKSFVLLQDYLEEHPELIGNPKKIWWAPENFDKFCKLAKRFPKIFPQPEELCSAFEPGTGKCYNKAEQPTGCAYPEPSFTERRNTVWIGAPDEKYHKEIVFPEWLVWLQKDAVIQVSEYRLTISLKVQYKSRYGVKKYCYWNILGKSYESADTKWSGAAVRGVVLTEGITKELLAEIRQRFKDEAFASWDYTPYEARNVGRRAMLADKVFRGIETMPLRHTVFNGFGIDRIPVRILPERKRKDLIRQWKGKPEAQARLHGKFYSNSPIVLSNLDRKQHCITWTKEFLFQKFPEGKIIRTLDLGYDHPTVCLWWYLTRSRSFLYRAWSEKGLSIGQRCRKIIELSGNEPVRNFWGKGDNDYIIVECHPNPSSEPVLFTIADYHLFKDDEKDGRPYVANYIREGLILRPSTTMHVKDRANESDRRLEIHPWRTNPETTVGPAPELFFLINEEGVEEVVSKLENVFWARFAVGDKAGEPKDTVQEHDDDEFDAFSYFACANIQWNSAMKPWIRHPEEFASLQTHEWNTWMKQRINEIPAGTLEQLLKHQENAA